MVVTNLVTNTSPGVLHRNGNPPQWQTRWPQIVEEFFQEPHPPCEPCPELTILTWNSRPAKSLLERCLDARGIPHVVLGKQVTHWRPQVKPFLNAEALARVETAYVMALDADDILMVACPNEILAAFMTFGSDIVFSAEKHSYPKVPFLYEFEKSIAPDTEYRHLNSGAWIGKTGECLRFFRECAKEDNADILAAHPAKHVLRDDQGLTRKTFRRFHPAAQLDYHCRMFQSLYRVPVDGEVAVETRAPIAAAGSAQPIQNRERAQPEAEPAAAPTKHMVLHEKLRGTRERLVAERAESTYLRGLLREYRGRLTRTDTALAKSTAAERQLAAMFGGYEERLQAQLAHNADRARRNGIPAAAAARAAHHASVSRDYSAAVSQWRAGGTPGAAPSTAAGLQWWTPANGDDPIRSPQPLPLDDLAAIRQFVVGGIMLDIGAGTGEAAIPRVLLGDFGVAYAAEPDADRFMCLVGNTLDNHLEGRVLPDRIDIGGATGGAEREPPVTLDAWVERLGVPADEIRFVRMSTPGAEPAVLQGATTLLRRQDVVWQIAVSPGGGTDELAALLGAHFTHVRDLDDQIDGLGRPASEAGAVLRARSDAGRTANLLLFNLG